MQAAKDAVKNFTSKSGHHDTTVHEKVSPAVTNETVSRHQEDRVTTALDKEVHQDHYHTSVQPVHHTETLPEKHHHNMGAVEHRNFEHDDHSKVKQTLSNESAKFKDQTQRVDGQHTTSAQPTVAGEHVHHHVHETVQPVIHKQTAEPHVVHTTVPIHEVHHNAAQHHATSNLPAMSMSDFKTKGGSLTGRDERTDAFAGCPKDSHSTGAGLDGVHSHDKAHTHGNGATGIAGAGAGAAAASGLSSTGHHDRNVNNGGLSNTGTQNSSNSGYGTGAAAGAGTGALASSTTGHSGNHSGHHHDSSLTGNRNQDLPNSVTGFSPGSDKSHTENTSTTSTQKKPSLMDRLNPTKDADHDGKKGFND